jgi:gamma-glutamyltranspeptidase/glutathione hydrolase
MAHKQRAAVASSPEVEQAAEELLKKSAVDAVVAGVFAACATSAPVLLGPVQILIGGAGAGLRAFDGRVRQPGIGAPRPRGYQSGDDIPDGARIGVPWLPATLSAVLATAGSATLSQVMAPAIALAHGTPRKDVLQRIAARGASAIEERAISEGLLAAAGRANGGLLTPEDLASPKPAMLPASRAEAVGPPPTSEPPPPSKKTKRPKTSTRLVATLPWSHVETDGQMPRVLPPAHLEDVAQARGVVAVDRNGTFAAASWAEGADGILLEDLGLRAPFFAEPVKRGVTRTKPGDARPAPGPLAFVGSAHGIDVAFAAFGAGDAYDVLDAAIRSLVMSERIEAHGEARLVAVSFAEGAASAFR